MASTVAARVSERRHRIVRGVLVASTVVAVALVLGATAYALRLHFITTALLASARQIQSTEDALHQISAWNNRRGTGSWTDSYDDGHATHYFVRVSNNGISRLHLAPFSAVHMRVTLRDGKLICVSVETWTPKASVVVLEWFRPEMSPEFYLRYVKAAIPTARVDFPSSLPDAEKKRAFDVSTSCLLIPRLCATTEDLLPLVRTLRLRTTPDPPKLALWPIFSHIYLSRPLGYLIVLGIALSLAVCLLSAHMKRRTRRH